MSGYPLPQSLQAARPNPEVMRAFFCFVIIQICIFQLTFVFIKCSINLGQFVRLSSPSGFTGGAPKPWGDESLFVFCCLVIIQISIFQLTFIFIKCSINLGQLVRLSSPSGFTGGAPKPWGDESLFVFCCLVIIQNSIFQLTFIFKKCSINLGQFVRLSSPSGFTGSAPKPWGDESLFVFCCLVIIQINIFQLTFIFISVFFFHFSQFNHCGNNV